MEYATGERKIQGKGCPYLNCGHYVFRGVTDSENHNLVPTIGRINLDVPSKYFSIYDYEKNIFNEFKFKYKSKLIHQDLSD